jgi:hypothetical protein
MKILTIILTIVLLIFSSLSMAQPYQIFLDLAILNLNAQFFPIGDLDFANTGLTHNYFNIQIRNDESIPFNMKLKMEIRYNSDIIATGISNVFILPPNGVTYLLTSQQLAQGVAMVDGQSIQLGNYDVDFGAVQNLQNQALQTGVAPSGTYEFILTAVDPNNQQIIIATDPIGGNNILTITNPTYVELLFPGNSVSDPSIMEINTTTPYAQWQTDVPPGNASYDILFYQKFVGDVSVQDVLNHPPVLQVEGYPNNFLQYPPSTTGGPGFIVVRPLEAGNTYYWLVRSNIQGPTETQTIESDVFRFRIADLAQANTNAQQILAILQQLLGTNYAQVLTTLTVQGFDPNGTISLDGQSGDINTLLDVANKVASGQLSIEDVQVY